MKSEPAAETASTHTHTLEVFKFHFPDIHFEVPSAADLLKQQQEVHRDQILIRQFSVSLLVFAGVYAEQT